jgi:cysteinyl-tRNA synthetase
MDDDFNTAAALGTMFELVRAVNHARDAGLDAETLAESQNLILELGRVLGLNFDKKTIKDNEAAPFIELLIEIRAGLRDQKLWALSDQVRDQLAELGVTLEDSKDGTTWRWA